MTTPFSCLASNASEGALALLVVEDCDRSEVLMVEGCKGSVKLPVEERAVLTS
jgi:hypothetical protein